MTNLSASLCLLALPASMAFAQATPAADSTPLKSETSAEKKEGDKTDDGKVQQVNISTGRGSDMEQRRQSSAAKLIFGREELDRNGDTNLGEVLKRLPGVSLGGRPGRGGEVRMRGMGAGFTQILINGERAPRGFSIESLAPDQVERIEVIRGTVAEYSTQAIAGTINIVMREGYQQRETQLKVTDSINGNHHNPNVALSIPGKLGNLTYTINTTLSQNTNEDVNLSSRTEIDGNGRVRAQEDEYKASGSRSDSIHFAPRLAWRFDNGDTFVLQSFAMHNHNQSTGSSLITEPIPGKIQEYAKANWQTDSNFTMGRLMGNWVQRLNEGGRLEMKFGLNSMYIASDTPRSEYDNAGSLQQTLFDRVTSRERGASIGGKYSTPLGEGHLLALGWDAETSKRTQTRLALVNNVPDPFNASGDDNLDASSRRLALFVQDEWEINKQWSANLGLRWESIRVQGGAQQAVDNTSRVLSPIMHAVWRIPGKEKDQIRMSATHSYRAPPLANLIALPALSHNNSETSPDRYGNPNLKPEQSVGLELAYEHYLSDGGIVSANFFQRDIKQLIRRQNIEMDTPLGKRWVSIPVNLERATTRGIELEAKFRLSQLIDKAPAIDLRANYSWYWSAVDGIVGPNNRIDQQARQSANLGMDYRVPNSGFTFGGSVNWTPAYLVQTSNEQINGNDMKRQLDVYALWKINSYAQLRLAANNLMAKTYGSSSAVQSRGITYLDNSLANTDTVWSLRLELQL